MIIIIYNCNYDKSYRISRFELVRANNERQYKLYQQQNEKQQWMVEERH